MKKQRQNEAKTDINLFNFIKNNRVYAETWTVQKQDNPYIQEILDKTSKKGTGKQGYPDLIYVNEHKKLLILIENKDQVKNHSSKNEDKPTLFAVDGIKHYLSFFSKKQLAKEKESVQKFFEHWKFIGIAFSGDIHDEYNHRLDTFVIDENSIENINRNEILDEADYLAYFENIDLEYISKNISKSSSEINRMLRTIDSQKRPVLLSALMICLYDKVDFSNDFKNNYSNWNISNIIRNIPTTVEDILKNEGIDIEKISVLTNEIAFIKTDNDLNNSDILKDILKELEDNVIPLFNKNSNYDIIGKFYEEFLRYAGITNVKKGIVLTPNHITKLFTQLVDIKTNDVILDTCCGTGAFLIAGMNKLIDEIQSSKIANKKEKVHLVKQNQLIGFEKSSTMYSLAISNMLFRGDGKSRIYNTDTFSTDADMILSELKQEGITPSIGFINPPYGGRDNKSNPTKKEIQFLEKMLDNVSRYGVIIAPLSTFFKDDNDRNRILSKHTLKYVINMPSELFAPNASTHTAIAVFETHLPHNDKEVIFYNLEDDGFILSKDKGRTDPLNRWESIEKHLLSALNNINAYENKKTILKQSITENDEWIIQAHSQVDYTVISQKIFERTIKSYVIFLNKLKLNLLEKKLDEVDLFEIFRSEHFNIEAFSKANITLNRQCKEFNLTDLFTVRGSKKSFTKHEINDGEYLYVTTSNKNNGVTSTSDMFTENGNVITIDSATDGMAFYQERKFVGSDHVEVLEPIDFKLNVYVALYLTSILNLQTFRYGFGRKRSQTRIRQEKLFLPIDKNNKPDWDFMENYIKSLPYAKSI
ncbi:MAG: N-6 DNA methylase [Moraxellaceae bacterium]|nr:N-6 DNA methylase [Moraxellaceae bacterium]